MEHEKHLASFIHLWLLLGVPRRGQSLCACVLTVVNGCKCTEASLVSTIMRAHKNALSRRLYSMGLWLAGRGNSTSNESSSSWCSVCEAPDFGARTANKQATTTAAPKSPLVNCASCSSFCQLSEQTHNVALFIFRHLPFATCHACHLPLDNKVLPLWKRKATVLVQKITEQKNKKCRTKTKNWQWFCN